MISESRFNYLNNLINNNSNSNINKNKGVSTNRKGDNPNYKGNNPNYQGNNPNYKGNNPNYKGGKKIENFGKKPKQVVRKFNKLRINLISINTKKFKFSRRGSLVTKKGVKFCKKNRNVTIRDGRVVNRSGSFDKDGNRITRKSYTRNKNFIHGIRVGKTDRGKQFKSRPGGSNRKETNWYRNTLIQRLNPSKFKIVNNKLYRKQIQNKVSGVQLRPYISVKVSGKKHHQFSKVKTAQREDSVNYFNTGSNIKNHDD